MPLPALYCRVSTDEQKEKQTIETQRDYARRYADLRGLGELLEFADDGVTGMLPLRERPGAARLLAAAAKGLVETVYIFNLKRLGRSTLEILQGIAELDRLGVKVASMTEPFDTSTPAGQFMVTVLAGHAQLDRDNITEQMQAGLRRAVREGRWVAGPAPYGYQLRKTERGQFLEPAEDPLPGCLLSPAAVVRLLYDQIGGDGKTSVEAQDELRRLGVPPRTEPGSRLNRLGLPVKSGWHAGNIAELLKKPVYKGELIFAAKSKRGSAEAECIPLVPASLWEATKERLAERRRHARHLPTDTGYLLSGLLVCGACGARMGGVTQTQRGTAYRYYRCAPRRNEERCQAGIIPMDETDSRVWREARRLLADPLATLEAAAEALALPVRPDERGVLEVKLVAKEQERAQVIRLAVKGMITEAEADQRLPSLQKEIAGLALDLEALEALPPADWRSDAERLLAEVQERVAGGVAVEARRGFLRLLLRRVVAARAAGEKWRYEWVFLPQSVNRLP